MSEDTATDRLDHAIGDVVGMHGAWVVGIEVYNPTTGLSQLDMYRANGNLWEYVGITNIMSAAMARRVNRGVAEGGEHMTEDRYAVAGRIRAALANIGDHYDSALIPTQRRALHPTPTATGEGAKMKPATRAYQHSPAPASIPALDARLAAHKDLVHYAQLVLLECRTVEDGQIVTRWREPSVHGLCKFLDVWALMLAEKAPREAAGAARDLTAHGHTLRRFAFPERPTLVLGSCPLEVDSAGGVCGGRVRLSDDTGDAVCQSCGNSAVPQWWEARLLDIGADEKEMMTADEVIGYVARTASAIVTHQQLRQWATRGFIRRHGRDVAGRTLYSRAGVLGYSIDKVREGCAA